MIPSSSAEDFISILKTDHDKLVNQFQGLLVVRDINERDRRWTELRAALETHLAIEVDVFYPAFLDATENSLSHFLASLSHESLMAQIDDVSNAATAKFKSSLRSLNRTFTHHVCDMERDHGMFDEARRSRMDHDLLAELLLARRREIEPTTTGCFDSPPA